MKKILAALLVLVTITTFGRGWEQIKGSGNLKKETRSVGSFTGLSSNGSMDVVISYGNSSTIEIEADDNLLPYIETKLDGGKLVIRSKDEVGFSTKNNITVRVQMVKVDNLSLSGSGDIKGDGAFANDMTTKLSLSGSGTIDLGFGSFANLNAHISGSGDIVLRKGSAKNLDVHISGSGKVDANAISFETVEAHISGSGEVRATASKTVDAHISGSGRVYYSGSATNISSKSSGSGKVVKI